MFKAGVFLHLLRALCGKKTSRARRRRFHHKTLGRIGFSHYQYALLTSYNSRSQYLVQVIKISHFAIATRGLCTKLRSVKSMYFDDRFKLDLSEDI